MLLSVLDDDTCSNDKSNENHILWLGAAWEWGAGLEVRVTLQVIIGNSISRILATMGQGGGYSSSEKVKRQWTDCCFGTQSRGARTSKQCCNCLLEGSTEGVLPGDRPSIKSALVELT